jgi:hypothetical protein
LIGRSGTTNSPDWSEGLVTTPGEKWKSQVMRYQNAINAPSQAAGEQGAPASTMTSAPPQTNRLQEIEGRLRDEVGGVRGITSGNLNPRQAQRLSEIEAESEAERAASASEWQARRGRGEFMGMPTDDSYANAMNRQADAMAARTDSVGKINRGPGEARYHQGPLAGDARFFEGLLAKEQAETSEGDALWNERQARYRQMLKDNAANPDIKPRQPMDEEEKAMRRKSLDSRLEGRRTALKDRYDRTQQEQAARDAYAMQMQQLAMMPPEQRGQYMAAMGRNDTDMARVNMDGLKMQFDTQQDALKQNRESDDRGRQDWNTLALPLIQAAPTELAKKAIALDFINTYAGSLPDDIVSKWGPGANTGRIANAAPAPTSPMADQTLTANAPATPPRQIQPQDVSRLSEKITDSSTPTDAYREARAILGNSALIDDVSRLASSFNSELDLTDPVKAEKEYRRILESYTQDARDGDYLDESGDRPQARYDKRVQEMRERDKDAIAAARAALGEEKVKQIESEYPTPFSMRRHGDWLNTFTAKEYISDKTGRAIGAIRDMFN